MPVLHSLCLLPQSVPKTVKAGLRWLEIIRSERVNNVNKRWQMRLDIRPQRVFDDCRGWTLQQRCLRHMFVPLWVNHISIVLSVSLVILRVVIDDKPSGAFVPGRLRSCQVQAGSGCRCLDINTTMMKADPLTDWPKQWLCHGERRSSTLLKGWAAPVPTERPTYWSYLCKRQNANRTSVWQEVL